MAAINGFMNLVKTVKVTRLSLCLGLLLMLGLSSAPAHAQLNRTWVASYGNDANTCAQASPCQTFFGAHAKTDAGGEINCLNSGSYGALSITKSISIICEGVVAGNSGFSVNAGANDVVHLRGLDIEGFGAGLTGVFFVSGAALHIENCRIRDFNGGGFGGFGIVFAPNAAAELYVTDTTISHNGSAAGGGGIVVYAAAGSTSKVVINRSDVQNNVTGIKADGVNSGAGGVINMTVSDTASVGNTQNGIVGTTNAGGSAAVIMVDRAKASHNAVGYGIIADGPKTFITFGASSIAGNAFGVGASSGGTLLSYGTNQIYGNSVDGTPVIIALK